MKFRLVFESHNLVPNIVFSAADADVSKAYVELGIGVAVLPHITYDKARDRELRARDVSHLFGKEIMHVGIKRNRFMRRYVYDFLSILSPKLTHANIKNALRENSN